MSRISSGISIYNGGDPFKGRHCSGELAALIRPLREIIAGTLTQHLRLSPAPY
jgi:hypothetical protein